MKLTDLHLYKKGKQPKLPPLKNLQELSEWLGVDRVWLTHSLSSSLDAPAPVARHRNNNVGRLTYYNPKDVKAWLLSSGKIATKVAA